MTDDKVSHERDDKLGKVDAETIEAVPNEYARGKDKASQLLQEAGHSVTVTPEESSRILRKIDWAILPILLSIYCLQSLDKTSLSYAAVFKFKEHAHLNSDEFSWLGSIVYVAQLVWQPVIAYVLVKFPIGKFCGAMVLCWGITLCGMAAANEFGGLMATRFLLGSFEASVAPIFLAIVGMWYRRSEQTLRNASWYSMLGIVNIFGSLLSWGLAHIQSNVLYPYQIIFLFCGLLTVVFSIIVILFLPDSPMKARFLKGDDKLLAIERVRMNQQGISSGVWRWDHVLESFLDLKTWLWFTLMGAISIPSGGISTFGPLVIQNFGLTSFQTLLFNMPFGAVQLVATLSSSWAATRFKAKSPVLALLCLPPIAGLSILHAVPNDPSNKGVLLFGYYITSFYPAITPLIYSWASQNTAGDTKRKFTMALMFIGQSTGNIIGPHLYKSSDGYVSGVASNLAMFVAIIGLVGIGWLYITFLNKKHAAARVRLGKSAKVVDVSMENKKELEHESGVVNATDGGVGNKAFDDVTDLKNEDFIYVY